MELLKDGKIKGYLFQQQNYVPPDSKYANSTGPAKEPNPYAGWAGNRRKAKESAAASGQAVPAKKQ